MTKNFPRETNQQRQERLSWWREARFGLFIHWGPVSLTGAEISWSRIGERRGCPNQPPGSVPAAEYDELYMRFNPVQFDAAKWVAVAQAAGMRYLVFTAKHLDGFLMFASKRSDYNIMQGPFARDVCAELAAACEQSRFRLGWYFSPANWRDPDCRTERNDMYVERMHGEVRELLTNYGTIDLLWFDTDAGPAVWDQAKLYAQVRSLQPRIIVDNRLDQGSMQEYTEHKTTDDADYATPEQTIGSFNRDQPWESCMTLGNQWSWKPGDDIKSLADCIGALVRCAGGDGNFLLNVGPMPSGEIEPRQVKRLAEIGDWLNIFGPSIYGTRGGPYKPAAYGACTCKGTTIYLHILDTKHLPLRLPPLARKILSASCLGGGQVEIQQDDAGLTLCAKPTAVEAIDLVIALEVDGDAEALALTLTDGYVRCS